MCLQRDAASAAPTEACRSLRKAYTMKTMISSMLIYCSMSIVALADSVNLGRIDYGDMTLYFEADGNAIMRTPEWAPGSPLPLEPNQVLAIIGDNWEDNLNTYELESIQLNRVIYGIIKNKWYYNVRFARRPMNGDQSDIRAYVVLLDGTLIKGVKK